MMKIKGNIRGMVYASAIAAIYVVLTLVSAAAGLSGGVIQFRLSEALTVLPVFTGAAVPGKAVKFPDQNHIEDFLRAVLYHPLEVRAVIRLGGVGTVDVGADHGDTVLLGVVLAVAQLSFNGRFSLAVR